MIELLVLDRVTELYPGLVSSIIEEIIEDMMTHCDTCLEKNGHCRLLRQIAESN